MYCINVSDEQLVGWSLTSLFSTNNGYIRDERSGAESYRLTQWRKASDILTSTLAAFLFSSHPQSERDREAHLNYYASAYNRGRQLSHRKNKQNQIQQNTTEILTSGYITWFTAGADNFCKTGNYVIYDVIIWVQDGNCKKWLQRILVLVRSTI